MILDKSNKNMLYKPLRDSDDISLVPRHNITANVKRYESSEF